MSAVRLDVRNLREILRLRYGVPPLSHRDIGVSCNISPSTVGETLTRFRLSDLGWPLPDDLDDKAKDLWNSLTGAISNAASSVTGSTTSTTTK